MENNFFNKSNYVLIGAGVGLLLLGYFFLAQPPVNGFLTLTAAPIILTIVYCVVFPLAIMWHKGTERDKEEKGA